jgi:hypothetical protein
MIIVFIDGMIFRSAEKRLLAKASLRWVRVSITVIGMLFLVKSEVALAHYGAPKAYFDTG